MTNYSVDSDAGTDRCISGDATDLQASPLTAKYVLLPPAAVTRVLRPATWLLRQVSALDNLASFYCKQFLSIDASCLVAAATPTVHGAHGLDSAAGYSPDEVVPGARVARAHLAHPGRVDDWIGDTSEQDQIDQVQLDASLYTDQPRRHRQIDIDTVMFTLPTTIDL